MSHATIILLAVLLFAAAPPASKGREKEEPTKVTIDELGNNRRKYIGKMVSLEVTVPKQSLVMEKGDKVSYGVRISTKDHEAYLLCPGKPDFKEGDRIRVTGRFDLQAASFGRLRIDATAGGGKVEKIPERK